MIRNTDGTLMMVNETPADIADDTGTQFARGYELFFLTSVVAASFATNASIGRFPCSSKTSNT